MKINRRMRTFLFSLHMKTATVCHLFLSCESAYHIIRNHTHASNTATGRDSKGIPATYTADQLASAGTMWGWLAFSPTGFFFLTMLGVVSSRAALNCQRCKFGAGRAGYFFVAQICESLLHNFVPNDDFESLRSSYPTQLVYQKHRRRGWGVAWGNYT